jgi:hypothetical protein
VRNDLGDAARTNNQHILLHLTRKPPCNVWG